MRRRPATLLAAAVLAAAVPTAGCGGAPAPPARPPVTSSGPTSTSASGPVTLTRHQACERLLADITRHRGALRIETLSYIADHVTAPRFAADARTAVRDLLHTGAAPLAVRLLRDDCARTGVRIPGP